MSTKHRVLVRWRRYGKGRRLRCDWPGGWIEAQPDSYAEDKLWADAFAYAERFGVKVENATGDPLLAFGHPEGSYVDLPAGTR